MFQRCGINVVVIAMGADPFDPDRSTSDIHRGNQPVIITFDVEDDTFAVNDAGMRISFLDVGGGVPFGLLYFMKPAIQRRPLALGAFSE